MCDYIIDGYTTEKYYILKNCNGEVLRMNKNNNIVNIIEVIYSDYNFENINIYYYNENDLYIDYMIKFSELEKISGLKMIQAYQDENEENILSIQIEG